MQSLPRAKDFPGDFHNRALSKAAAPIITANGWDNPDCGFTVTPARYAKGMYEVRPRSDGSGWKTVEQAIASDYGRYVNRAKAYVMSPGAAEKFAAAVAESRKQTPVAATA